MNENRFARLSLLIGGENLKKINEKRVLILGVGGVGGYVAESLARSGIGNLILVDFDTIDITNINRQIIALTSTIGQKKVTVLKKRIKDINPECNIITIEKFIDKENYQELFNNDIDYFVDCCDSIETKKLIIKQALQENVPIISSMGVGNRTEPNLLEITEIKKTSGDPLARIIRKYLRDEKIEKNLMVLCSKELPQKREKTIASNAFVPPTAGLLIGSYIIKELINKEENC